VTNQSVDDHGVRNQSGVHVIGGEQDLLRWKQ